MKILYLCFILFLKLYIVQLKIIPAKHDKINTQTSHNRKKSIQVENKDKGFEIQNKFKGVVFPLITGQRNVILAMRVGGFFYNLIIDTGSSNFIIKGRNTPGIPRQKYSSNYEDKNKYQINFASAKLKVYEDNLVAQIKGNKINIPTLVTYQATNFFFSEGIIGLSYPKMAKIRPTFLQSLINNKIIDKNAFGLNINLLKRETSFITFGQPDQGLFDGNLQYYPVKGTNKFYLKFRSFGFDENSTIFLNGVSTLLDSGSTTLTFPTYSEQLIKQSFKVNKNYCNFISLGNLQNFRVLVCKIYDFDDLPSIKLTIKQKVYDIPMQYYLKQCYRDPRYLILTQNFPYYCRMNIKIDLLRRNKFSLGCPFFNRYYVYFDLQDHRVGIARNKQNITIDYILQNFLTLKYPDQYPLSVLSTQKQSGQIDIEDKSNDTNQQTQEVQEQISQSPLQQNNSNTQQLAQQQHQQTQVTNQQQQHNSQQTLSQNQSQSQTQSQVQTQTQTQIQTQTQPQTQSQAQNQQFHSQSES